MGNIIFPFAQFLFGPFFFSLIIIVNFETNKVDRHNPGARVTLPPSKISRSL